MGFLSGVLGAVKNENEVITYDVNGHLNKLPQEINKKMYKGPHEFCLALSNIGAVLGYYDAEVNRRINAVVENNSNGTLYALQSQIDKNIRNLQDSLTTKKYEDVVAQWKDVVTDGLTALIKSAESAINELDTPLKTKVTNDFEKIKTAVNNLNDSANRDVDQLRRLGKKVEERFSTLRLNVYTEIRNQINALDETLKKAFAEIKKSISAVEKALAQVKSNLASWSEAAMRIVNAGIKKCEKLLERLDEENYGDRYATIRKNAEILQRRAPKL
ncbi:hypothetical protein, conserved [Babesia bigemina]|uniref:Uncharacterized protein n=1 Tax=Babesia bigemina TaxID=5866 RepID=A0A061BJ35_BABBI|nr:hypothetical protein, conserved [Babesia bigemina]CDR71509.1 hypothetical protein, conserved [Babesia bigemina]|eukprot:XP_012770455.1 hypothetical protein, conserved [Babesia bigemina]